MKPPSLESDPALLAGFRRGEPAALGQVLRIYVEDVARVLRKGVLVEVDGQKVRVGANLPETEIEVLLQDTFVRAFRPSAREAYDGLRPYAAYLVTIARNLLVDHGRRLQREARLLDLGGVDVEAVGAVEPEVDTSLDERELHDILERFRGGLDEGDQRLFQLRYEEEKNLAETARVLGWSEIRVRKRDTWIRSTLLQTLRAAGFLEHARVRIGRSLLGRNKGGSGRSP